MCVCARARACGVCKTYLQPVAEQHGDCNHKQARHEQVERREEIVTVTDDDLLNELVQRPTLEKSVKPGVLSRVVCAYIGANIQRVCKN